MSFRVAVFTSAIGPELFHSIHRVLESQPDTELKVLFQTGRKPLSALVRNQFRNFGRHGWRWAPYLARHAAGQIGGRLKNKLTRKRRATAAPAERVSRDPRVSVQGYPSLRDPRVAAEVRAWGADLGLSLGAPILKEPLFNAPRLGTLNIHKGKVPDYRGMPPAFWELWNGETSVGATVHKVEASLDTGDVIAEGTVPIEKFSTLRGLRIRLDDLGDRLICDAVARMRAGTPDFRPQPGGGKTYTRPTLAQERQLQRRLTPRRPLSSLIKTSVLRAYSAVNRFRSAPDREVVIFLYHRVSDQLRDSVTVGIEQFENHVRFLSDHYPVVSVADALSGDMPKSGPVVAITFDDGYLDNYQNAAPILLKHGVHATFFVSTDKVARNEAFQHDIDGLGHGLPNMSWAQIRELHREGLGFGSHTANHINLAQSSPELVREELSRSRQALHDELGIEKPMFAYPFGRRCDLKPGQIEDIKAAGFACNCSAYGGVNPRQVDRWDVRRQGVDFRFDLNALAARIAGMRATHYV